MLNKIFLLSIIYFCLSCTKYEVEYTQLTISGQVLDIATKAPITDTKLTLYLKETYQEYDHLHLNTGLRFDRIRFDFTRFDSTFTDEGGNYFLTIPFEEIPPVGYRLRISKNDYVSLNKNVVERSLRNVNSEINLYMGKGTTFELGIIHDKITKLRFEILGYTNLEQLVADKEFKNYAHYTNVGLITPDKNKYTIDLPFHLNQFIILQAFYASGDYSLIQRDTFQMTEGEIFKHFAKF